MKRNFCLLFKNQRSFVKYLLINGQTSLYKTNLSCIFRGFQVMLLFQPVIVHPIFNDTFLIDVWGGLYFYNLTIVSKRLDSTVKCKRFIMKLKILFSSSYESFFIFTYSVIPKDYTRVHS